MIKALGAAILLHLLLGASVQRLRPKMLGTYVAPARTVIERSSPIAIDFLPPAAPPRVSASPEIPLSSEMPGPALAATHKPGRTGSGSRNQQHRASSERQIGIADYTPPHPAPTLDRTQLMTMRNPSRGKGMARFDTRLAANPALWESSAEASRHNREDLVAASPLAPRDSSPWRPASGGTMRAAGEPYRAKIHSDGRIEFQDKPNVSLEGIRFSETYAIPVIAGRFDVTDAVMASIGETLYPYRKMKLMNESRAMRVEMARVSKKHDLQQALRNYEKHLRWVWNQSQLPIAERRKALFRLWDECAEAGSPDVLAIAGSVRAMTLDFVRRNARKGTEDAFTEDELRMLNRSRYSNAEFSPY